ncbi:MAG: hypothetical protein JXQ23_13405 [Clostridia bacterium]|nr:hypothetical protein [Clostridia bacterium]
MKKLLIISLLIILLSAGCIDSKTISQPETSVQTLDDKFAQIDFYLVSGIYSRNVLQDNVQVMELFALDKTSFVRTFSNDYEQEVFAYNYISDDFTYLYYFEGDMISKTAFNITTGMTLQDNDGYRELLTQDADELKAYFIDLIDTAGIKTEEIK